MINTINYTKIKQACKTHNCQLVAVSKTRTEAQILALYKQNETVFGENRVLELIEKAQNLPKNIKWHLIGHLQRNKVKQVLPYVSLIHSVDSMRLLNTIQQEAKKLDLKINILLQFHIAQESKKYGFEANKIEALIQLLKQNPHKNIIICGVMGMATFTKNKSQIRLEFKTLKQIFDKLKQNYFSSNIAFKEISMGMSSDYEIALEEGSTIIRVGSALFS